MSTGSSENGYPLPAEPFNAIEHARNKILRANQTQEGIIQQWKSAYEDFYGLLPNGGSQYTSQQMQQVLEQVQPMAQSAKLISEANERSEATLQQQRRVI